MPVRHVLVVDDSKSARLMLRKMLQGFGLTVDTVESAEEALNYLRSQRPDAIFMDHTMPGMDGLTAVRRIHADPDTAAIPVAMYTSKEEPAYRSEAYAAGAMDVLTKPAVPDVLGAMLERMSAFVSYTHLDVYKRQLKCRQRRSNCRLRAPEWVARPVADATDTQCQPCCNPTPAARQ